MRAENGTVTSMQEVGKMGKGACSWDEQPFIFTVVSYILPIYCSALQRSCQRKEGLRIKKGQREKQAEDTHGKPDQSPIKAGPLPRQHTLSNVRGLRGQGATGLLMKVMVLPSKHIHVGIHSRNSCCMDFTGKGFLTLFSP